MYGRPEAKGVRPVPLSMKHEHTPLDEVDRGILQLLQRDARHSTAVEIGEAIGVSDGTVRNRVENLENKGIIEGYIPVLNYERAGYPLQINIECTASVVDREQLAKEARKVDGVIDIRETMTGRSNIHAQVVAPTNDDVTEAARQLNELDLQIEDEDLVRHHYQQPFNHFGIKEITTDKEIPNE